ncbi:hypothetical protein TNCV_395941 [Trichonephila clavipes]|nr:hypothetical protein TNCV_395941 [Trichonephila clavipes]
MIKHCPRTGCRRGSPISEKCLKSVFDNHRSGRQATTVRDENIEEGKKLTTEDRRLTVFVIADERQINREINDSWCLRYDPETKWHIMESLSPALYRRENIVVEKSRIKTMIITFFNSQRIIHNEFLPEEANRKAARYI